MAKKLNWPNSRTFIYPLGKETLLKNGTISITAFDNDREETQNYENNSVDREY